MRKSRYNPDWTHFAQTGELPDALSLCNGYGGSAPYLGSQPCTSQPITEDNPSPNSFSHYICKHGRHPLGAYLTAANTSFTASRQRIVYRVGG